MKYKSASYSSNDNDHINRKVNEKRPYHRIQSILAQKRKERKLDY